HPLLQVAGNVATGIQHIGNIRLPILVQRRRNTDNYRADLANSAEIRAGGERAGARRLDHGFGRDVLYVAPALIQRIDLRRINVQSQHCHSAPGELKRQWQAHITQPDYCYFHAVHLDSNSRESTSKVSTTSKQDAATGPWRSASPASSMKKARLQV